MCQVREPQASTGHEFSKFCLICQIQSEDCVFSDLFTSGLVALGFTQFHWQVFTQAVGQLHDAVNVCPP